MLKLEKALEEYNEVTGATAVVENVPNLLDENDNVVYAFVCGSYDGGRCTTVERVVLSLDKVTEGSNVKATEQYEQVIREIEEAKEYHLEQTQDEQIGLALAKYYEFAEELALPMLDTSNMNLEQVFSEILAGFEAAGKTDYIIGKTLLQYDNVVALYASMRKIIVELGMMHEAITGDKMMEEFKELHTFVKENISDIDFSNFSYRGKDPKKIISFATLLQTNRENEIQEALFSFM